MRNAAVIQHERRSVFARNFALFHDEGLAVVNFFRAARRDRNGTGFHRQRALRKGYQVIERHVAVSVGNGKFFDAVRARSRVRLRALVHGCARLIFYDCGAVFAARGKFVCRKQMCIRDRAYAISK